ncbi:MAG: BON domain-containing protein [Desulfobacteraceae bacterium]|jgi:pilus assembly protein CpaC|nr:MAG: BON domain-containing protein [Desulfobacteraceae bacterium]
MRMIRPFIKLCFLIFAAGLAFTTTAAWAQLPDRITIAAGESRVVKTGFDIEKIAIGNPDICGGVKTDDQELLINGKKPGQSNIFVWGPDDRKIEIQVTVESSEVNMTAADLRELTQDIEGVSVRVVGSRIFMEGEVFTHNDMRRIERVIEGIPNVVNLVEFSPVMKDIVKSEIEKALAAQGMRNVKVSVTKNNFMLTGSVGSEAESARAQRIAEAYSPDIINAVAIQKAVPKAVAAAAPAAQAPPPPPPRAVLIEMSLNIMEIERGALRDFGIHWNPGASAGGTGSYAGGTGQSSSFAGSLTGTISNLIPKMRKINEAGRGRSLMQQTLITKSGDAAQFFAGSEIPIPIAQSGGTMSVDYKKVGVTLNFKPEIDYYNNIVSIINVESSSITGAGPGGVPIISNTNLNTVLSVPDGHSIALGGLVGQRELESQSSAPPGGDYALYMANKAEREATDSREVIIFVTPRILSDTPAPMEIQKKVEDDFKQQELERLRQQAN